MGAERASRSRKGLPKGASRHNYRLLVEYDGTRYAGFQVQPSARTVAGELTAAARDLLGEPVSLFGAGRTDAGVHAEGQVVNFLARRDLDVRALREGLNDRLPADINVLDAARVHSGFHARTQAIARTYRYQISTRRDAFRKRLVWWLRSPLDRDALAGEAAAIVGTWDFSSFTDADQSDARLAVHAAGWTREGDLLLFRIQGERFVRKMVRRLVGAMIEVGLGRERPGLLRRLIAEPAPGRAATWTAPPSGLVLERVDYPGPAPHAEGDPRPA